MFSISERWVPGGRGAASTFTIRITDETAKMIQNECRSNRCFSGKGAINIAYGDRGRVGETLVNLALGCGLDPHAATSIDLVSVPIVDDLTGSNYDIAGRDFNSGQL